jgi:putative transposase
MHVSTSSYYAYLKKDRASKEVSGLESALVSSFWRHKRRYGSRLLVSEMYDEVYAVGRERVSSILKIKGFRAIQPKSFIPKTTKTHPTYVVALTCL